MPVKSFTVAMVRIYGADFLPGNSSLFQADGIEVREQILPFPGGDRKVGVVAQFNRATVLVLIADHMAQVDDM
jgi:hypothetical protein